MGSSVDLFGDAACLRAAGVRQALREPLRTLVRMNPSEELSPRHRRVAREIVAMVRRDGRKVGDHLPVFQLAEHFGTSRAPIQAALKHLEVLGVVQQDTNRGFFLRKDAHDWGEVAAMFSSAPDDPLYLAIAQARLSGDLPDEVNESELMRRFGVARSTLRKVLARVSEEGWAEQRVGSGWAILPMIDSVEAYEESYLFRQAVEPTGIMNPRFMPVQQELESLRKQQAAIVDGGFETMTAMELFEANSRFHETLAEWSGNRFIVQSVRRINLQRRLVEYSQAAQRQPRQTQAREHLGILDAIESLELAKAAGLLRSHLDGARRKKSQTPDVFARDRR